MTSEIKQVYINVGLVGHVANGKTTLVNCLSGVNTKRDSEEKKSGRTVKMGYANCILWKCKTCNKIFTTGQNDVPGECCDTPPEVAFRVSFVDCPGHHSYVNAMIKGSSIIDCAILVTDVRADKLQTQSIEHLIVLDALNVRRLLVLQNKVDLVDRERCLTNYSCLREELKGTVAETSPVIPISAQNDIGLDHVRNYLYTMVEESSRNLQQSPSILTIVRSFDINKPGACAGEVKGGVIGVTNLGKEGYKIGDEIEIRPGIVKSEEGVIVVTPLKTKILSIFSETTPCTEMCRGGLYGVGTDLSPELAKADGMVGCLAGCGTDLPPVIDELEVELKQLKACVGEEDSSDAPKIQKNHIYTLISGNTVVRGVTTKRNGKKWTFKLSSPVCVTPSAVLVYTSDAKSQLIAVSSGVQTKGNVCIQTPDEYVSLLPKMIEKEHVKSSLPVPHLSRENCNLIWGNISVFCASVKREPLHVSTYIKQELCMEASICQAGLRLYKTRINVTKFQTVLTKYVRDNVCCGECKSINTELRKNPVKGYDIHCFACGSERALGK